MQKVMFSLFDERTGVYNVPFPAFTTADAERTIGRMVTNPQTEIFRDAADYNLYRVGTFDQATGMMHAEPPSFCCNLLALRQSYMESRGNELEDLETVAPASAKTAEEITLLNGGKNSEA